MNCPECGAPMKLLKNRGYNWQNQPVHKWRCTANNVATHWVEVWDPEPPWTIQLHRLDLTLAFLERYHYLPADDSPLPEDYNLQPRLF